MPLPTKSTHASNGSSWGLFFLLVIVGAAIGGTYTYMTRHYAQAAPQASVNTPAPVIPAPPTAGYPTGQPQVAPPPVVMPAAPTPAPAVVSDLVTLTSTDGRSINAKILVISATSVFVRREDNQTFDLPLDRLTQESKDKIEEYRLSKIYGGGKK